MGDRAVFVGAVFIFGVLAGMSFPAGRTDDRVTVKERWAPLTQFSCSRQEHIEYHGACAHRKWADARLPAR